MRAPGLAAVVEGDPVRLGAALGVLGDAIASDPPQTQPEADNGVPRRYFLKGTMVILAAAALLSSLAAHAEDHEHTWQDTGPAETMPCFKPRNLGGGPGSKSCTPQKCACGKTQTSCGACS